MRTFFPFGSVLLFVFPFLLFLHTYSHAQTSWVDEKLERAAVIEEQKGAQDAIRYLEHTLVSAKSEYGLGHLNTGEIEYALSSYYMLLGQKEKGEKYLLSALSIYRENLGENLLTADVAQELGELYKDQGRIDDAVRYFKEAEAIYRKQPGPPDGNLVYIMENLAEIYKMEGKDAEAAATSKEAEELIKKLDAVYDGFYDQPIQQDQPITREEDFKYNLLGEKVPQTIDAAIALVKEIKSNDPRAQLKLRAEKTKDILMYRLLAPNKPGIEGVAKVQEILSWYGIKWNNVNELDKLLEKHRENPNINELQFAWDNKIGRCYEHSTLFSQIMSAAGESDFKKSLSVTALSRVDTLFQ